MQSYSIVTVFPVFEIPWNGPRSFDSSFDAGSWARTVAPQVFSGSNWRVGIVPFRILKWQEPKRQHSACGVLKRLSMFIGTGSQCIAFSRKEIENWVGLGRCRHIGRRWQWRVWPSSTQGGTRQRAKHSGVLPVARGTSALETNVCCWTNWSRSVWYSATSS